MLNHVKTLLTAAAVLATLVAGTGTALAQDDGAAPTMGATASEQELLDMSQGDRLAMAADGVNVIRGTLDRVNALREEIRTDKESRDFIALSCVNEKLSAIKGYAKVAEKAELALQSADTEKDQVHQTKLVNLASMQVRALGEQAESCTGNAVPFAGPDPELDVEIDEDVRTDNPTFVETTDVPTDPLPDASPYQ